MTDLKITSASGLISATIKTREETYYLVTDSNLKEIKGKNSFSSIFVFLDSILWGAFFSNLITLNAGVDLKPETITVLNTTLWVFLGFGIVFLLLVGYFMFASFKSIKDIKSTGEVILESLENEKLTIIKAQYGANGVFIDLASELNKLIKDNKLVYNGKYNDIIKDPIENVGKTLTLTYKFKGQEMIRTFEKEDTQIELP